MSTDKVPPEGVEAGAKQFSPRAVKFSALFSHVQKLHPRDIDLKRFGSDPAYRLATMIYGKDHVKLVDIPEEVLADVIIRALHQVQFKCGQARAPKKTLDEALYLGGSSKDFIIDLPEGVSREKMGVYASFYPRELNPATHVPIASGLEEYADTMVVIADSGFYMWLPVSNRLVEATPELLTSIFQKDRFVGWYFLWGIKQFIESLVNEANRQLWIVTPLQDEVKNILSHISLR